MMYAPRTDRLSCTTSAMLGFEEVTDSIHLDGSINAPEPSVTSICGLTTISNSPFGVEPPVL